MDGAAGHGAHCGVCAGFSGLNMFEHYRKPLLPRADYHRRLIGAAGWSLLLISASLLVGMAGYHWLENLPWIDAFVSASMILSGMGPVGDPQTYWGKLFAGTYALYSGFVALISVGVMGAPMLHRFLHRFHIEEAGLEDLDT